MVYWQSMAQAAVILLLRLYILNVFAGSTLYYIFLITVCLFHTMVVRRRALKRNTCFPLCSDLFASRSHGRRFPPLQLYYQKVAHGQWVAAERVRTIVQYWSVVVLPIASKVSRCRVMAHTRYICRIERVLMTLIYPDPYVRLDVYMIPGMTHDTDYRNSVPYMLLIFRSIDIYHDHAVSVKKKKENYHGVSVYHMVQSTRCGPPETTSFC